MSKSERNPKRKARTTETAIRQLGIWKAIADAPGCSEFSPLTPALSPLRGEGEPQLTSGCFLTRCRMSAGLAINRNATGAEEDTYQQGRRGRASSPLNGERAGVRGESALQVKHLSVRSDLFRLSVLGFRIF
jgi:hypothetical protein